MQTGRRIEAEYRKIEGISIRKTDRGQIGTKNGLLGRASERETEGERQVEVSRNKVISPTPDPIFTSAQVYTRRGKAELKASRKKYLSSGI